MDNCRRRLRTASKEIPAGNSSLQRYPILAPNFAVPAFYHFRRGANQFAIIRRNSLAQGHDVGFQFVRNLHFELVGAKLIRSKYFSCGSGSSNVLTH